MKNSIFLALIGICVAQVALAGAIPPPPPPVLTPIDGGLSLIIGGGIAYLAKKQYDKKRS